MDINTRISDAKESLERISKDIDALKKYYVQNNSTLHEAAVTRCRGLLYQAVRLYGILYTIAMSIDLNTFISSCIGFSDQTISPLTDYSLLRGYKFDPDTGKLECELAPLPSYRVLGRKGESRFIAQLSAELRTIPEDIQETLLGYEAVTLDIIRYYTDATGTGEYDMDNGGYHALLNAIQYTILRSENVSYLKRLSIFSELSKEKATKIILSRFEPPD